MPPESDFWSTSSQTQGPENLQNLPLDRHLLLGGQVLDELLGDGGAALDVTTGKHGQHASGCADPVHAVVLPEAVVLNGDGGVDEVLGNVLILHPDAVAVRAVDGAQLLKAAAAVGVIHGAGEGHIYNKVAQIQIGLRHDHLLNIDRRKAGQKRAGGDAHQKERTQNLADCGKDTGRRAALLPALSAPRRRGMPRASAPGLVGICQNNTSVSYGALYILSLFLPPCANGYIPPA